MLFPFANVDVVPCSLLAFEAIGEDSGAWRGNSEMRRAAYRKDRLLR